MSEAGSGLRPRVTMASDSEWKRIEQRASAAGMKKSRFPILRALGSGGLPLAVEREVARQVLVLAKLEERRLREAGAGEAWDETCAEVDAWLEREGELERLTDPGAANRWKAVGRPDADERS